MYFLLYIALFLTSCHSYNSLSVDLIYQDKESWPASHTRVGKLYIEDDRKQHIIDISYSLPTEVYYDQTPFLKLTLLYRNGKRNVFSYPLKLQYGSIEHVSEYTAREEGVFGFKADIILNSGKVYLSKESSNYFELYNLYSYNHESSDASD